MKIQIFQFYVEYGNVKKNEQKISEWFNTQLDADTEVVVLPEMWNNGYALEELNEKQIKHYHVVFLSFRILLKHIKLISSQDLFQTNEIIKFIILLLLCLKKVVVLTI